MTALHVDNIVTPPDTTNAPTKRDLKGRYRAPILTDNRPGPERSWTRVTNMAGRLEDQAGITNWKLRKALQGGTSRESLIASAQAHDPDKDKNEYTQFVEDALEIAGANEARKIGTAVHRMTEDLDNGIKPLDRFGDRWRPLLGRYQQVLDKSGWVIEHVEQVILIDGYQVAGTIDRVIIDEHGERCIADIKTSANLDYGYLGPGIQLAAYANHDATCHYKWEPGYTPTGIYRTDREHIITERGPQIKGINREYGYIIHLPWQGEHVGTCTIHKVEIGEAWAGFICADEVGGYRRAAKKWGKPVLQVGHPMPGDIRTACVAWLEDRIKHLIGNDSAINDLMATWPQGVPQPFPKDATPEQINQLAAVLSDVEAKHGIPFGPARPGGEPKLNNNKPKRNKTK